MRVTLLDPADYTLEGTVVIVEPNERLILSEVVDLATGLHRPIWEIPASNIADIKDASLYTQAPSTSNAYISSATPTRTTGPPISPAPAASSFPQDPAILSMSRPSAQIFNPHPPPPNIGEKRNPLPADTQRVTNQIQELHLGEVPSKTSSTKAPNNATPSATDGGKRTRRGGRGNRGQKGQRGARLVQGNGNGNGDIEGEAASSQSRGSGWRNTPILESTKSFQPFASLKRGQNSRKGMPADNGWASEDPTDVQGAGDFDFEGNHAKFNKRDIFNEYRQQDEIDEADRLVSHNRLPRPKPGTAGGKNLHYTENVLDMPSSEAASKLKEAPQDAWNQSEADDVAITGGERLSGREGSGRTSRLRNESRLSTTRRSQSRKASAAHSVVGGPVRTNSGPVSTTSDGLYVASSDRRIEPVTHLQMLNLENIAQNEIGLTETLMAENAGRGIAEVAIMALADPAIELRNSAASPPSRSTIVVLAGNNKAGSRAIAASRHLGNRRQRDINVLVCVVGIERERELDGEVQRQINIFRKMGGTVCSKTNLFQKHLRCTSTDPIPVTLIIDALFGLSISFEELRKSDQATTYELMQWAIRNEAFKLAIDVPSGIDPATGKVNVIDEGTIYLQPRYICAIGAPKQGLLKAIQNGYAENDDAVENWKLYLVDVCLHETVWRKAMTSNKHRRGIDFDDKWVLEMRYQPSVDESD